uniref:EF-hand domain-containing protein n=1 Tax=Panagrolaimus sp. JU765 TaxID=591449 RepID=A0AC34RLU5_9BILA
MNVPTDLTFDSFPETDLDSISDLLRYEPPTKPPTMEQLMESTKEQFSKKWIKYMYSKFKCECPDGRMKLTEFKNLFSFFVPNRISDAYLERMFKAICYNSVLKDQITFRDFMESLAMIQTNTPKSNAEWTIRLINPRSLDRVTFEEFHDFVKSIFLLVGGDNNQPVDPIPLEPIMDKRTAICIKKRAYFIFNQMDSENCGFISRKDLERFFATHQEAIMTLSYQFVL